MVGKRSSSEVARYLAGKSCVTQHDTGSDVKNDEVAGKMRMLERKSDCGRLLHCENLNDFLVFILRKHNPVATFDERTGGEYKRYGKQLANLPTLQLSPRRLRARRELDESLQAQIQSYKEDRINLLRQKLHVLTRGSPPITRRRNCAVRSPTVQKPHEDHTPREQKLPTDSSCAGCEPVFHVTSTASGDTEGLRRIAEGLVRQSQTQKRNRLIRRGVVNAALLPSRTQGDVSESRMVAKRSDGNKSEGRIRRVKMRRRAQQPQEDHQREDDGRAVKDWRAKEMTRYSRLMEKISSLDRNATTFGEQTKEMHKKVEVVTSRGKSERKRRIT